MNPNSEAELRERIFTKLRQLTASSGGSLTRTDLENFEVDGTKIPLIDRNRGIRNPRDSSSTLSIMSKPGSEYEDDTVGDSLFSYAYRKGPIDVGDNVKLRRSYVTQLPFILLRWIDVGAGARYVPIFPVFTVADNVDARCIVIALDQSLREVSDPTHLTPIERRYAQSVTKRRLHQPQFRIQVLMAYQNRCALCMLGRPQLLEAAHIIADSEDHSTAAINNGLSLCNIHHAAFDRNLVGISPDFKIHIGPELMDSQNEGPILEYALKGLNNTDLHLPASKKHYPAKDALAERFDRFLTEGNTQQATRGLDMRWLK
ncbi:HNH endonuclease [Nocardia stercoris]|uniref:HNH endonuclease n=1 Tax=Nocardia stercoris TaxID=2483361 RepID=UPI001F23F87F|nr:HNH endonuclease [Nocardia stercoris]